MFRRQAVVLAAAALVCAPPRRAVGAEPACLDAHVASQQLRAEGKLRAARERLLACSAKTCPALVKVDCTKWLTEVEAAQPTVILSAKDDAGHDLVDVKVSVDGQPLLERLDGQAVAIDPGAHKIRWVRAGAPPLETDVVLKVEEKGRALSVTFPTASTSVAPPRRSSLPWVLLGVSGVALGSFVYFGWTGNKKYDELTGEGGCAPRCDPAERDAVVWRYRVADVSLGVSVLSLGAATVLFLTSGSSGGASSGASVRPVAGGVLGEWTARF